MFLLDFLPRSRGWEGCQYPSVKVFLEVLLKFFLLQVTRQRRCSLESCANALQKQVGCFNHRVVTLVADKLERQWLREFSFGIEE